jgi:membrane-associated phospholipid phosphatase
MNTLLAWDAAIVAWIQGLGQWLVGAMKFFSFLGTEEFFLLIAPALVWCVDVALGIRIGLILLFSDATNSVLKLAFGSPRPFWISDKVTALSYESSFGLPSGHAQTAMAVWGRLAAGLKRRWAIIVFGLLIFLISLSRLYLGVHFLTDVLGGWLVGGLLLWLFLRYEERVARWMQARSLTAQIAVVFLLSILILVLGTGIAFLRPAVPEAWINQAAAAAPGEEPINPLNIDGVVASAGALFGLATGAILLARWPKFNAGGVWWKRVLRYLVGVAGVALLYFGLKFVLPSGTVVNVGLQHALPSADQGWRYLRYALVGFWVTYLGPRAFVAMRLA